MIYVDLSHIIKFQFSGFALVQPQSKVINV